MARNKKIRTFFISNTDGFNTILKILLALLLLLILICVLKTCIECRNQNIRIENTGWIPANENWDNIPDIVPPYDNTDFDSLLPAVSLEHLFPPIGKQNPYNTCVAWAVGYNLKTALNAKDNRWTREQLDSAAYQTSPKDLYMGIPQNRKGTNCQGSYFEDAFRTVISNGVTTMDKAPHENFHHCDYGMIGDSTNKFIEFGKYPTNKELIKAYINDSIPLVFGAMVGNRFMGWKGNAVFNSDIPSPDGGHAMVLVGYDDSKNAFRVRNSWGTDWGDEGSIWIDYDFFCSPNFGVDYIFVAKNK